MSPNEVERLKRLRDQQISARDPRLGDQRRHRATSVRPRAAFSIREELRYMGAKLTWTLWGALIGLIMGVLISTVLWLAFQVRWGEIITLGTVLFAGFLGRLFGGIKDSGREDWR